MGTARGGHRRPNPSPNSHPNCNASPDTNTNTNPPPAPAPYPNPNPTANPEPYPTANPHPTQVAAAALGSCRQLRVEVWEGAISRNLGSELAQSRASFGASSGQP